MNAHRFDLWSRIFATSISRRSTLASLTLGVLTISREMTDVAAGPGCKNVGKKCKTAGQ